MNTPIIKPIKLIEYDYKQSKYDNVPKLPMRALVSGPSGSGKTVLLASMILDIYRGCFNRIYVFSPSADIDQTWQEVKKYVDKEVLPHGKESEKEKCFFSEYDQTALEQIVNTQSKITRLMKDEKAKKLYQILIVIDDFADSPEFVRREKLVHQLYIRGRHSGISTITATQSFKQIAPIVRKNITHLFVFKLRNKDDLDAIIDEISAVADKKTLLSLYKQITDEPHAFLYINLMSSDVNKMFFKIFEPIKI